jgi:hypothetical protein
LTLLISLETGENGECRFLQATEFRHSEKLKQNTKIISMRRIYILFTFAAMLLVGAKTLATSPTLASVSLAWQPSPSSGVTGYDIYYGTSSGNYITAVPVFGVTNLTIYGLTSGQTYYFAATSVDSAGDQSAFSPEISGIAGAVVATQTPGVLSQAAGLSAGQFGFNLSGTAGAQYAVEASTDLVNWVTLQTNVAPFQFIDSNAVQFPRRFYRTLSIQ